MGVYTTPAGLARVQRARLAAVAHDIGQAHALLAGEGKKDFLRVTGGPLKSKTLKAMGHPFARSGATVQGAARGAKQGRDWRSKGLKKQISRQGMVKRLPINIQSGRLRRAITLSGPQGAQKMYKLFSNVPYAKYVLGLKGTRRSVERGLLGPHGYLRKMHKARKHTMKDTLRQAHRKI